MATVGVVGGAAAPPRGPRGRPAAPRNGPAASRATPPTVPPARLGADSATSAAVTAARRKQRMAQPGSHGFVCLRATCDNALAHPADCAVRMPLATPCTPGHSRRCGACPCRGACAAARLIRLRRPATARTAPVCRCSTSSAAVRGSRSPQPTLRGHRRAREHRRHGHGSPDAGAAPRRHRIAARAMARGGNGPTTGRSSKAAPPPAACPGTRKGRWS